MLGSAARSRGLQEPVLEAMKHKSPILGVAGNSALPAENEFRHHHCYRPIGFIAGSYTVKSL